LPSKHIIMHSFILFHKSDIELQILYRVASESNLQLMETVTACLHHKLIYKSFRRLLKQLSHYFVSNNLTRSSVYHDSTRLKLHNHDVLVQRRCDWLVNKDLFL
jgi:hypothetical protein